MNTKQKIIIAIQNRKARLRELNSAEKALAAANINAINADAEVARQIKNHCGVNRAVVFGDEIFTVHATPDGRRLSVTPSEYEILTTE